MKKLMICVFLLFASVQFVFSIGQSEIAWSTMLNTEADRNYARSEIMSLLIQYNDVYYNIHPMTRAAAIQRHNQDRAEARSLGASDSDIQAQEQVIGWLQNNNNQNFAYAIRTNTILYGWTKVGVVRGNNYYRIGFMNGLPVGLDANAWEFHHTRNLRDLFERHINSILR